MTKVYLEARGRVSDCWISGAVKYLDVVDADAVERYLRQAFVLKAGSFCFENSQTSPLSKKADPACEACSSQHYYLKHGISADSDFSATAVLRDHFPSSYLKANKAL